MANFTTPVALNLLTAFLYVPKSTTRVALLLVSVVAVSGHMAGFATVVTDLLSLLLRLLAVPRDVATPSAVVASCRKFGAL